MWLATIITLGAGQFGPTQKKQREDYFAWIITIKHAAGIISGFLGPALRTHIHCFGRTDCYPAVYGFSVALALCHFGTHFSFPSLCFF